MDIIMIDKNSHSGEWEREDNMNITQIIDKINFNSSNDDFYEEIYPNIWLMDNHKWALYCWELNKDQYTDPVTLVHLDYHWDGVNDYIGNEEKIEKIEISELFEIISEERYIRKDSFIAPAIIRGYINNVHFHCFQDDTEIGLDDCLLKKYSAEEYIHENIEDLISIIGDKSVILNLDLDIFNKSSYFLDGELWVDADIREYILKIKPLIQNAKIITVAMSYGHSGNNEQREYLTRFVLPLLVETRGEAHASACSSL